MAFAPGWPPRADGRSSAGAARRAASGSQSDSASADCPSISSAAFSPRRGFDRTRRLRQKSQFDAVYRSGQRSVDAYFAVLTLPNEVGLARLGLSVAARTAGSAVNRNRVKRVIRESFRSSCEELPAVDIVVSARNAARLADNDILRRSLEAHWRRLKPSCAPS